MTKKGTRDYVESLFGNSVIEKVLFFLITNEKCYPSQRKNAFNLLYIAFNGHLGG